MTPLKIVALCYFGIFASLFVWAYWDTLWGWDGLFFYHTEPELGHMLAYLGTRYELCVFRKHFSWVGK